MLLPSVFPCEGVSRSISSARTSVFPSQEPAQRAWKEDNLSSCRALQAILGASAYRVPSPVPRAQRPTLVRTPAYSQVTSQEVVQARSNIAKEDAWRSTQPSRKHRRDDSTSEQQRSQQQHARSLSEASTLASTSPVIQGLQIYPLTLPLPSPMLDQENTLPQPTVSTFAPPAISTRSSSRSRSSPEPYSTPKRRRIAPVDLPLGLQHSDFESLNMPPGYGPPPLSPPTSEPQSTPLSFTSSFSSPPFPFPQPQQQPTPEEEGLYWTDADDTALVHLLLSKMRISKRDWNECARILGKDKDSMGRRWRYLIGNGEVGMRRGGRSGFGIEKGRRSDLRVFRDEEQGI